MEWRKSACGTGMPKMSDVNVMKACLLSYWKDVNENNDVSALPLLGLGGVGIGEVSGGGEIKLVAAYGAKARLICDRCVVYKLGLELSFNMAAKVSLGGKEVLWPVWYTLG